MKKRNFFKYHQAKVYDKTRYENPYFSYKQRYGSLKIYLIIPILIFVSVLVLWALIAIPWMHISKTNVQGLITIQPIMIESAIEDEISQRILKILPGNHIWLINESKIISRLENEFQLTNISIQRDGRGLDVIVNEKITKLVWVDNGKMSFIGSDGNIVRQLTLEEQTDAEAQINTQVNPSTYLQSFVIPIWDLSNTESQIGTKVLPDALAKTIIEFDDLLRKTSIQPISYQINNPNELWLNAKTTLGIDIYFDGEGDAREQFDNLQLILSEYKNDIQNLEYIDLRFDNRVYIR